MNCQVSFGGIPHALYDEVYKVRPNANGTEPDRDILKILQSHTSLGGTVADIGAGLGRNTFPLLKMGYHVDAFEISESARQAIQKKSHSSSNLRILDENILKKHLEKERYDLILMAHVSQHFSENEMGKVVANFFGGLKKGGLAVFDALLDKTNKMPKCSDVDTHDGVGYFKGDFVEDLAKKNNFEAKSIPYNRNFETGSDYIGPFWGFGDKEHKDFRPLELRWFTFKKP